MAEKGPIVSFAQNREDVLLARVFSEVDQGFYVDVGANDPTVSSVTRHFYDLGWRGINLEPGRIFAKLVQERPRDINLNVAASDQKGELPFYEFEGENEHALSSLVDHIPTPRPDLAFKRIRRVVPVRTLADIFDEFHPPCIDFMSVDVEMYERPVLLGNNWTKYRPRVVLVESTLPMTPTQNHVEWEDVLLQADYHFVYFDGLNRYYLRQEDLHLAERFELPPNVFDNYIVSDVLDLRGKLGNLHQHINAQEVKYQALEKAYQHLDATYQHLIHGTGPRSRSYGLWIARQISRLAQVLRKRSA
ncbi:MAG: FkbM family methyltransferase [Gemmataceae bacterium]